jgi:hypothetical protein
LITINRTNVAIAIVGRPWSRAVVSHARSIGANSAASAKSSSSRARSGGSSRTPTGSTSSNSDST